MTTTIERARKLEGNEKPGGMPGFSTDETRSKT
jgi:hypothetical protein